MAARNEVVCNSLNNLSTRGVVPEAPFPEKLLTPAAVLQVPKYSKYYIISDHQDLAAAPLSPVVRRCGVLRQEVPRDYDRFKCPLRKVTQ